MAGQTVAGDERALRRRPAQRVLEGIERVAPGARPAVQRGLVRGGYAVVSRWLDDIDAACMDYGYAPLDGDGDGAITGPERFAHQLYERVAGAVDLHGCDVLEVGCGRGGGTAFLAARFGPRTVTGLDAGARAIAYCRAHHSDPRLRFVRGDAQRLPFPDGVVDAVVNIESSHAYPDVPAFLAEVRRVLRPGGHLLFADLRLRDQLTPLRAQLRDAGLDVVEEERITPNVVRALALDTPRRAELIHRRVPRPLRRYVWNFFAAEGSSVFEALRTGDLEYVRLVAR